MSSKNFVIDMNVLRTLRTIIFENRLYLLWCVVAICVGYALGRNCSGGLQADGKSAGTDLQQTAADTVQLSTDYWQMVIQMKIDEIARNIKELKNMHRRAGEFSGDAGIQKNSRGDRGIVSYKKQQR